MKEETQYLAAKSTIKQVVIVVMSGNLLLNFAGPADVFTIADKYLGAAGCDSDYDVKIVSPTAEMKVKTASGMEIHCAYCAMDITTPIDTLIIAGNNFT
ncbi:MAG: GlxA family transcriptional regulator, partial [Ferruginibacter sp.]